ncbi:MAG TPA: restriction endonuclease [Anaerolineales bacterium]|nr:restriction endonuclease [Anaerolineales bacterium]
MELISPLLQLDFREYCVSHMVLRQINDVFSMAGVKLGQLSAERSRFISGQRRTLVEEYYSTMNWHSETDAEKFLKVISFVIAQAYTDDERKILRNLCEREGFVVDGIQVYRQSSKPSSKKVTIPSESLAEFKQRLVDLSNLEPQQKGFAFEKFLNDLFEVHGLVSRGSFRPTGEQIDGSFELNSDVYLLEAKWQTKQTSQDDLLIFRGKVESKSTWSRGLFVSDSGLTEDGLKAFSKGKATNIIGMTGQDLFFILSGEISLQDAISSKVRRAAETGEFYVSVYDLIHS